MIDECCVWDSCKNQWICLEQRLWRTCSVSLTIDIVNKSLINWDYHFARILTRSLLKHDIVFFESRRKRSCHCEGTQTQSLVACNAQCLWYRLTMLLLSPCLHLSWNNCSTKHRVILATRDKFPSHSSVQWKKRSHEERCLWQNAKMAAPSIGERPENGLFPDE